MPPFEWHFQECGLQVQTAALNLQRTRTRLRWHRARIIASIATCTSLQPILQSNIEALKGAARVIAPFMLLRIRFGPFAACLSLSLTTCLCCTVTAVIAGWHIGLWRGAGRQRAAAVDPKVHNEASNSSCAGQ